MSQRFKHRTSEDRIEDARDDDYEHFPLIQPCWRATEWKAIHKLQCLELVVALLFFVQLVVLVSFGRDMLVPMYIPYISWPAPTSARPVFTSHDYHVGNFSVLGAIAGFFALSAVFTAVPVTWLWQRFAGALLYEYVQYAHYFEWCFTASDMALIIAVLNGVTDVSFLYVIFASVFTVMILGYIQECDMSQFKLREAEETMVRQTVDNTRIYVDFVIKRGDAGREAYSAKTRDALNELRKTTDNLRQLQFRRKTFTQMMVPHALGWVLLLAVVSVFFLKFVLAINSSVSSPPAWVFALYALELFLFSSFGLNQLHQMHGLYHNSDPGVCQHRALRTEARNSVLGFLAKSVLCWILYGNLLAEQTIAYPASP